jgi:hypothetical protein
MSEILSRGRAQSKKLLALARELRNYGAQTGDPYYRDMMRCSAEELERAAAKATRQDPATHRGGAGELLWLDSSE